MTQALMAAFDRLTGALAVLAGLILVAITLLIAGDVAMRNLGIGRGIAGVIELVEYGLYAATLLGSPWALRLGAHVTVEIGLEAMAPPIRRRAEVFVDLVGVAVCLAIAWGGFIATTKAFEAGRLVFKSIIFPEWWLFAPLPVFGVLLAAEFLLRLTGVRKRPQGGAHLTEEP